MNTIHIIALVITGLALLYVIAVFSIKAYVDHMSSPRKEKFAVDGHLLPVPQMPSEETHDVLAYSLGYYS